jgi:hypothetical protein
MADASINRIVVSVPTTMTSHSAASFAAVPGGGAVLTTISSSTIRLDGGVEDCPEAELLMNTQMTVADNSCNVLLVARGIATSNATAP